MDESIYIPTLIIACIFLCIYAVSCKKNDRTFNVSVLVNTVLCSSGVSGGGFLVLSTFMPSLKDKLSNLNLYIFIAGIVVLVVSLQSIYHEVTKE